MIEKDGKYKICLKGLSQEDRVAVHNYLFSKGKGWSGDDQYTYITQHDYLFVHNSHLYHRWDTDYFIYNEGIELKAGDLIFTDMVDEDEIIEFKKEMLKYV